MSILDDYEREMRNGEEEAAVAARGEKRRNTYRTVPDGWLVRSVGENVEIALPVIYLSPLIRKVVKENEPRTLLKM